MNIEELIVYKVNVQALYTGSRIEAFTSESYMFLDYDKAMDFAFGLATDYANTNDEMPIENNELIMSHQYIWVDDSYTDWDKYAIYVVKSKLDFTKNVINKTKFNDYLKYTKFT